jgi:DHA2 family multidrug resistance protein
MASQAAPAPASQGAVSDKALRDEPELVANNHVLLVVGIMAASLLQILDTTIANVAIPHMQSSLGTTVDGVTWVLTSYIIASAVALPITGWLADRVGSRQLFIYALAGFIFASTLCGAAQNLEEMVLFRAMQGVAGGFIMPLSQAFMLDTSKPSRHPQMMALWGMGVVLGPILGPIIGGWLTETASWRWVFYVNVPAGLITLAILIACLPQRDKIKRRFDMFGFVLLGVALTSLQLLLDRGHQLDWFASTEIWIYTLVMLSATWMAIVHFTTAERPLYERTLFKDRNLVMSAILMMLLGVVVFAVMALLPPMLQNLFGYDVIETGVMLAPRGFGVLFSMQMTSMLLRRGIDARPLIALGFVICGWSLYLMAHWSLDITQYHLVSTAIIQGVGMGLVLIPLQVTAFSSLPARLRTDGSSIINLSRSLGASVGISMMAVLLARNIQVSHQDLAADITSSSGDMIDFSAVDQYQAVGDAAVRLIDLEVNRQAAMIAYLNDFYLIMWLTLLVAPLAFLMKRIDVPQGDATPPGK